MKKLFILALAVFMIAAFAMPASALQNKFGGYWENVFSNYKSLNYQDDGAADYSAIRSRTRLFYTAILNDNLKLINQFEMDTSWGQQTGGYGDSGADGMVFEVKRTYVDANLANFRWEIGTQNFKLNRGFIHNTEATGLKVSYRGADNMIPAFWWFRLYDGDREIGNEGADVDHYTALVNIKSGNMQFVPSLGYLTCNSGNFYTTAAEAMNVYFAAMDFNMKADAYNLALTGIYEGGELSEATDISAFALYGKVGFNLGNFGIRLTGLYTSGEEETAAGTIDGDYDGFWYPEQSGTGAAFSTSELYRKGKDWTKVPNGPANTLGTNNSAPNGNAVENRMEFGIGVDFKPAKDWKIAFDYWNLNLAEDAENGNADIGNEFDLVATYKLMKNMNLDLIGAYLIVGDAIKPVTNDSNAYETSARLRLSF